MKNMEEKNDIISVMINICTRVVTLIFFIVTVSGCIFNHGEVHYSVRDVFGILLMGVISGLSFSIYLIKKNMTKKDSIIFQIIHFLILNVTLMVIGLYLNWFEKEFKSIFSMELMFTFVFLTVTSLVYIFDFNETKKINQKLKDRKKDNL